MAAANYYVLGLSVKPRRWMDTVPYIEDVSFMEGTKITNPVPDPVMCELETLNPDASDHGPLLPAVLNTFSEPLFRDDFIEALRTAGVDNFDLYNTAVRDPDNGQTYTNYKLFNLLGVIAAADMKKSKATYTGPPLIDVAFDELVVDPLKAGGLLMFRLAEATATILVHEAVRDSLGGKFDDLEFYSPGEVAI